MNHLIKLYCFGKAKIILKQLNGTYHYVEHEHHVLGGLGCQAPPLLSWSHLEAWSLVSGSKLVNARLAPSLILLQHFHSSWDSHPGGWERQSPRGSDLLSLPQETKIIFLFLNLKAKQEATRRTGHESPHQAPDRICCSNRWSRAWDRCPLIPNTRSTPLATYSLLQPTEANTAQEDASPSAGSLDQCSPPGWTHTTKWGPAHQKPALGMVLGRCPSSSDPPGS